MADTVRWILVASGLLAFVCLSASPAAALTASTLEGARVDLSSLEGQVVILNFWATWCAPCRSELPLLGRIQERYAGEGVVVVALSTDLPGALPEVRRVAAGEARGLTVWTGGTTVEMEALGLPPTLPATAILDRRGKVAARLPGVVTEEQVEEWLEHLLRGGKRPEPHGTAPPAPEAGKEAAEDHHEGHEHGEGEEEHQHGGVGIEGASLVPS